MELETRLKGFHLGGSIYLEDEVITARPDEENWLEQRLIGTMYRKPLVVIGPRQSGKSTLLKRMTKKIQEEGSACAYVSLEELRGLPEDELGKRVWPLVGRQVVKQIPQLKGVNTRNQYCDWELFSTLGDLTESGKIRNPVIFFDEFSYVALHCGNWFGSLRGKYETSALNCKIVLTDRAHPTQYPSHGCSPFNITEVMLLGDFREENSQDLLEKCANLNGVTLTTEHTHKLHELTKGQTYLTQIAGYRLVAETLVQNRRSPNSEDVNTVIESMNQDARAGNMDIYSTLAEYLKSGSQEGIKLSQGTKEKLRNIVETGRKYPFILNGDTGVLVTLGFVTPESRTYERGEWRMTGNVCIRNPLYKLFLRNHTDLLW
ncbi:MAG: AAA family ATPase [Candidatus Woesearchaeota archaeon]|jgi:GTPase SAR1 family protein